MIIGISMDQEICLILGQGFTQFTPLDEKPPDGYMRSRDPGQIIYGGRTWQEMQS